MKRLLYRVQSICYCGVFIGLGKDFMPLWKKLYNTVWFAFLCCVLFPRWMGPYLGLPVHAILGLVILVVTLTNVRRLGTLPVPERLKRISKVTAGFAVFQLIAGIVLGGVIHLAPTLPVISSVLRGTHIVIALAILAQTSSVATAYDMWEEKEFGSTPSGKG
jgi:hypothetical protein